MKKNISDDLRVREAKIARLVQTLRETERQLQDLTGGGLDAIASEDGKPYLLREAQAQLLQSEAAQRELAKMQTRILDALPATIALVDKSGIILSVNEAWRKFAIANSFAEADFGVGRNYVTVCEEANGSCSEEAGVVAKGIRSVVSGEELQFSLEYPCHSPNQPRWFRLVVTPLQDQQPGWAVIMHFDITQRKLAEDALQQSESLLRMALEVSRMGAWKVDLATRTTTWSEQVCAIHDLPSGFEPTFEKAIEFYAPEYRDMIRDLFGACVTDGVSYDQELQIITAKGRRVWVRTIGEPVRDQEGRIVAVQGAFHDINERKEAENSLAASEARFRHLAESMPMIVWTATADGEIDFSNQRFSDYTGVSRDEPPATRWQGCLHSEDLERCMAVWQRCVASHSPFEIEYRIRRGSDGSYRWFRVQAMPVQDDEGNVTKWYGTAIDIDETKRLETEATELAARLSTTLESITDAFFTVDRQWKFTYLNSEAERLLERSRADLIGKILWEEFKETMGSGFEREYRRAMVSNETVTLEELFSPLHKWFEVKAYPSREGLAVYFRDVTLKRKNREALREQATLLDKAQDAILVRDLDHTILYWNKSAERLYGWEASESIGRSVEKLLYEDPAEFLAATKAVMEVGEWMGEIEQFAKSGEMLAVEGRWTLVRDDQGRPKSILAINTDITERKKLEAQFLRAQRMESIGTLAGGIAHDLNNLLSPIVLGVDLIKQFDDRPDVAAILNTMGDSAKRGTDLVKQVLSFARGVEGTRIPLHIGHFLSEVEAIVENTFPKNITFRREIGPDLWLVLGDPTQLNQVFVNLCVNARDAMPDGGNLTIAAHNLEIDEQFAAMSRGIVAGPYVKLEVSDQGCGMRKEVAERVFEPFFTTKDLSKGTGLGLSTVSGIVRSHGGTVTVYSEYGKGSVFKIYLPAQPHISSSQAEPEIETLPRGKGECILVVDDEASILNITRQTLEAFGYRVIVADDGAQAIGLYAQRQSEIALVLTDMMMPIMDGPALIKALRRINPDVRIIAASGLNANGNVARASDAGVKHFLPKPYSAEHMLVMLRTVLANPAG